MTILFNWVPLCCSVPEHFCPGRHHVSFLRDLSLRSGEEEDATRLRRVALYPERRFYPRYLIPNTADRAYARRREVHVPVRDWRAPAYARP